MADTTNLFFIDALKDSNVLAKKADGTAKTIQSAASTIALISESIVSLSGNNSAALM